MLNFVRKAFRGGLEAILWINLLLWTICGGIAGNALSNRYDNYTFMGVIIGIAIGLIINIIGGGLIATILNIDENLEQLRFHITGIPKKVVSQDNNSTNSAIPEGEQYKVKTSTAIRSGPQHDAFEKTALNTGDTVCFNNFLQDDPSWCYVKAADSKTEGWCFFEHLEKC